MRGILSEPTLSFWLNVFGAFHKMVLKWFSQGKKTRAQRPDRTTTRVGRAPGRKKSHDPVVWSELRLDFESIETPCAGLQGKEVELLLPGV